MAAAPGRIVILNGAPRAGKSSLARAIQDNVPGIFINLGVDVAMAATPRHLLPGIGLRPGGERPDLEPFVAAAFAALFDAIAAHSRQGLDVVADLGLHDNYSKPLGNLATGICRLSGLPVLFVGVRCELDTIMARRNADPAGYLAGPEVPEPVRRWQAFVHEPGLYDLELDMGRLTPEQGAAQIAAALANPPKPPAFEILAERLGVGESGATHTATPRPTL